MAATLLHHPIVEGVRFAANAGTGAAFEPARALRSSFIPRGLPRRTSGDAVRDVAAFTFVSDTLPFAFAALPHDALFLWNTTTNATVEVRRDATALLAEQQGSAEDKKRQSTISAAARLIASTARAGTIAAGSPVAAGPRGGAFDNKVQYLLPQTSDDAALRRSVAVNAVTSQPCVATAPKRAGVLVASIVSGCVCVSRLETVGPESVALAHVWTTSHADSAVATALGDNAVVDAIELAFAPAPCVAPVAVGATPATTTHRLAVVVEGRVAKDRVSAVRILDVTVVGAAPNDADKAERIAAVTEWVTFAKPSDVACLRWLSSTQLCCVVSRTRIATVSITAAKQRKGDAESACGSTLTLGRHTLASAQPIVAMSVAPVARGRFLVATLASDDCVQLFQLDVPRGRAVFGGACSDDDLDIDPTVTSLWSYSHAYATQMAAAATPGGTGAATSKQHLDDIVVLPAGKMVLVSTSDAQLVQLALASGVALRRDAVDAGADVDVARVRFGIEGDAKRVALHLGKVAVVLRSGPITVS